MTPSEYRIQSMRMMKKEYGFDLLVSTEGSEAYFRRLELFAPVRQDDPDFGASRKTKGVVRIKRSRYFATPRPGYDRKRH